MTKIRNIIAVFILLIIPVLFISYTCNADSHLSKVEGELEEVFEKIDFFKMQIDEIEREISSISHEIDGIEAKKRKVVEAIKDIQSEQKGKEQQIAYLNGQIGEKEEAIESLQESLAEREEGFNDRLRTFYKQGYASYFHFFAGSNSIEDFFSRLILVSRILRQDAHMIYELKDLSEELTGIKQDLKKSMELVLNAKDELTEIENSLIIQERQLGNLIKEKEGVLLRLEQKKGEYEVSMDSLMETSRELEDIIRRLQKSSEGGSERDRSEQGVSEQDVSDNDLGFDWPARGRISSGFGWRIHPVYGTRRFHSGIDIAIVTGTPIKAAEDGRVIYAGWVRGYGETVIIDHGNEITTLYAHNSVLQCYAGQRVDKGQIIAESGSTGTATGPHLHFEIRIDGTPVNPMDYLP